MRARRVLISVLAMASVISAQTSSDLVAKAEAIIRAGNIRGSVLLAKGGRLVEMDARPCDALALALGNAVPVFVAEAVLDQAGIDVDRFDFRKLRDAPPNRAAGRVEVAL